MSSLTNGHASPSGEATNVTGNSREQALAARALKRAEGKAEKKRKAEMRKEEVSCQMPNNMSILYSSSSPRETPTSRPVDIHKRLSAIRLRVTYTGPTLSICRILLRATSKWNSMLI